MKILFKYSIINSSTLKHHIIKKKQIIFNSLNKGKFLIHKNLCFKKQYTILKQTKTRAEVKGGGKKPYKQKGTGHARLGSIRSPLKCGGGIIFGPKIQKLTQKINKKTGNTNIQNILYNYRFNYLIFDKLINCSNKTKSIILSFSRISPKKVIIIITLKINLYLQQISKNWKNYKYITINQLNIKYFIGTNFFIFDETTFLKLITSTYLTKKWNP